MNMYSNLTYQKLEHLSLQLLLSLSTSIISNLSIGGEILEQPRDRVTIFCMILVQITKHMHTLLGPTSSLSTFNNP